MTRLIGGDKGRSREMSPTHPTPYTSTAVVGEAAGLRDKASWFENKPLFGWQVLVPRTKAQAGGIVAELRS